MHFKYSFAYHFVIDARSELKKLQSKLELVEEERQKEREEEEIRRDEQQRVIDELKSYMLL